MSAAWANQNVIDIGVPEGFERVESARDSYSGFLRNLPIKTQHTIQLWDGSTLPDGSYNILAVLDLPLLFDEDLEQCADFSMRLWAEFLKSVDELHELSLYDFHGRQRSFSDSGKSFRDYLYWHMKYSNSYSLKRGAKKVRLLSELKAGDMFVQNDSEEGIGHVSVVLDEAINSFGLKVYLVGYSFMPAQQFHIEKADLEFGVDGWFSAKGYFEYAQTVFGSFGEPTVMRFERLSSQLD